MKVARSVLRGLPLSDERWLLDSQVAELDQWIRRKLRCYRIKQRKQGRSLYTFLSKLGVPARSARVLASSGKGWWRLLI